MLSTQIATHKVIVKNPDLKWITKYPLTKDMYVNYRLAKNDRQIWNTIWLTDLDWVRIRELDPIKFEEFEEIKPSKEYSKYNVVCSFWVRHPMSQYPNNCNCKDEFDCLWFAFKDKLKDMWYKIHYDSEISDFHRQEYKNKYWLTN